MSQRVPWLLVIDTATSLVVVAAGTADGNILASRSFQAKHRHGERLLPAVQAIIDEADVDLAGLTGIVVGTGPGAFTGLRAGLATAKTLAHELGLPIAGVSSGAALLAAARDPGTEGSAAVLWLPAGPHDRIEVLADGAARLITGGDHPGTADDELVAVDLTDRAPEAALARGRRAQDGLARALLRLGATRLAAGRIDDVDRLVPEYVMLPRGVRDGNGAQEMAWSRDRR